MADENAQLKWEGSIEQKYKNMIAKIPLFHREIADQVVRKKASLNAQERGADTIGEEDVVRGFFSEVPMAFYSLMIRLMDEVGFDYKPYESKKNG